MKTTDARSGIESLDREECLRLLAGDEVGRLAVNDWHTPIIFPVNYRLDGEAIVFRTGPGTKASRGTWVPASFEIDAFDREHHRGWSVVVVGRLEEVTRYDSATLERVHALGVDPWAGGERTHWMRLVPERITGRRVGAAAAGAR